MPTEDSEEFEAITIDASVSIKKIIEQNKRRKMRVNRYD
jgi:hypothetical protein